MSLMSLRRLAQALLAIPFLFTLPHASHAFSAVFDGDPVNPTSSIPYELLPGAPLVQAGADGILGTADDVVDPTKIGDIDMVVRSGSPAATAILPAPSIAGGRAAVPVGIAGSVAAGGTAVPFTVFLSDGVRDSNAPYGHLLPAADMDNIPVIVGAFGDLDGDGWIGPTDADAAGASDNNIEIHELETIGRAVALFSGGVARGSVAIHAGLPASQGGLGVVLCALSLTGPFDPNFQNGEVPSGPAISTAFPFVPQRDLGRLFRDRAVLVGPNTTVQNVIQFAALPSAANLALPLNGASPTVDVAVVRSQLAVGVSFVEISRDMPAGAPVRSLALGTRPPSGARRLRMVPADRFGNPADPPADFSLLVSTTSQSLRFVKPRSAVTGKPMAVSSAAGLDVVIGVRSKTPDGSGGTVLVERAGAIVAALPYHVDARLNRPRADVHVPSKRAKTIQAAIDTCSDKNHDGQLTIDLAPGIYRENVRITRPALLRGHNPDTTILQGDGSAPTLTVSNPNVTVLGISAVGGTSGFAVNAVNARLSETRAWSNSGAGFVVNAANATLDRAVASGNGGNGLSLSGASAVLVSGTSLIDNSALGASLLGTSSGMIESSVVSDNGTGGLLLSGVSNAVVEDNSIVNNIGVGVFLDTADSNRLAGNVISLNDDDGIRMDRTNGNLVSANVCDTNHGYGIFTRRGSDDFSAESGVQTVPGDNLATGNRKGDVFVRTN